MKVRSGLLLLFLLLTSAGWLTFRSAPDWGDDWAQYLEQARWLQHPDAEDPVVRYLYDPSVALYAPPLYPWGWPVVLACLPNANAIPLLLVFIYVAWGILLYYYILNRSNSLPLAGFWAATWALTPYVMRFKWEALSDLPFAAVVLAYYLWMHRFGGDRFRRWGGVALVFFSILIRPLGWALVLGALLESVAQKKNTFLRDNALHVPLMGGFLALGAQYALPHVSGHSLLVYAPPWHLDGLLDRSLYYLTQWRDVWSVTHSWWPGLGALGGTCVFGLVLGSAVYGVLNQRPNEHQAGWGFVGVYGLALLLFPNQTQGFRYLVPLIPWLVPYALPKKASLLAAATLLVLFVPAWNRVYRESKSPVAGPESPKAKELFREIANRVPASDTLVATRPRALSYLAQKYSLHAESLPALQSNARPHRWWVTSPLWPKTTVPQGAVTVWSNGDFALFSFETLNSQKVH